MSAWRVGRRAGDVGQQVVKRAVVADLVAATPDRFSPAHHAVDEVLTLGVPCEADAGPKILQVGIHFMRGRKVDWVIVGESGDSKAVLRRAIIFIAQAELERQLAGCFRGVLEKIRRPGKPPSISWCPQI